MEKEISYYEKLAKEDLILLLIEQRGLKLDYDYQHFRFVIAKIDGLQNIQIQELLQAKFGLTHSLEYISSLWRNKIPKLIIASIY